MTNQEISKLRNNAIQALNNKEIKEAFDTIHALITQSEEWYYQDKLTELEETYKHMLSYLSQGVTDPMQKKIYNDLCTSTYELCENIWLKTATKTYTRYYFERRRNIHIANIPDYHIIYQRLRWFATQLELKKESEAQGQTMDLLPEMRTHERVADELFNKLWLSDRITSDELEILKSFAKDSSIYYTDKCLATSALTLSLLTYFDEDKLDLLFDFAENANPMIRIRAFVGILLTIYTYQHRIELYPGIINRLASYAESPTFIKDFRSIMLKFILSRDTEKISKQLQEEIIPEMMKTSADLKKKFNIQDLNPETLSEEMNPEWEEELAKSKWAEKFQELNDLQSEGADVLLSSFSSLKNMSFFSTFSNWFLPFTEEFSEVANADSNMKGISKLMVINFMLCDSDRYSFWFTIKSMSQSNKEVVEKFSLGDLNPEQDNEGVLPEQKKVDFMIARYLQNLYRFYKLHPRHLDFKDIFNQSLDFYNQPVLAPYISDVESLTLFAESFFKKKYYEDALHLFHKLVQQDATNETIYQKIGYCYQMLGKIDEALKAYQHAELLNPDSKWTLRKLAGCYKQLKQPENALQYYRKLESISPNNLNNQINIGHCYLELKNYQEALTCYFKVEFLDQKSTKSWRAIAWCSFLTKKYEQAQRYYSKIIQETNATPQDFLNAGHTEWALHDMKNAIELYLKSVRVDNGSIDKFIDSFRKDIPELISAGINADEIPIILDQIRYKLEE